MKDRFLFKGKRVDNGEWVYGGYSEFVDHSFIVEVNSESQAMGSRAYILNEIEIIPKSVGQCTTKKASNGIMYEGDIVKGKNGKVWKIVWNKTSACFQFVAISFNGKSWNEKIHLNTYLNILQRAKLDFSYLTIIGNIHDERC